MADVVLKLPVDAEESILFGRYLNRFMESRAEEAARFAAESDAPYLMLSSDPAAGAEAKILVFQEQAVARAFHSGWTQARSRRSA